MVVLWKLLIAHSSVDCQYTLQKCSDLIRLVTLLISSMYRLLNLWISSMYVWNYVVNLCVTKLFTHCWCVFSFLFLSSAVSIVMSVFVLHAWLIMAILTKYAWLLLEFSEHQVFFVCFYFVCISIFFFFFFFFRLTFLDENLIMKSPVVHLNVYLRWICVMYAGVYQSMTYESVTDCEFLFETDNYCCHLFY